MLSKYKWIIGITFIVLSILSTVDGRRIKKPEQGQELSEEEQDDEGQGQDDEDQGHDDESSGSVSLGTFDTYAHQLGGDVTLLNENTMEISGLNYDGTGPAAWFMLGKTSRSTLPEFIELEGTIIPDENGNCETLSSYSRDDITLKLPAPMKFTDYNYISMYCIRFNHNFGYVMIPDDMKLKNATAYKNLKACDQDDIEDAEDNRQPAQRPGGRPPPRRPPSGGRPGGLLGGLLNSILG